MAQVPTKKNSDFGNHPFQQFTILWLSPVLPYPGPKLHGKEVQQQSMHRPTGIRLRKLLRVVFKILTCLVVLVLVPPLWCKQHPQSYVLLYKSHFL